MSKGRSVVGLFLVLSMFTVRAFALSPGDVVINEFIADPVAVSDTSGEWVELYNNTDQAIDLEGCIIKDDGSDTHTIASGSALLIPARGYIVLGRNTDPAVNGGATVNYAYSSFYLSNSADEVVLLDQSGTEIDRVVYDTTLGWPFTAGKSVELLNSSSDNNNPVSWQAATTQYGAGDYGTPGSTNSGSTPPPQTVVTFSGQVENSLGLQVELWMDHPDPELREIVASHLFEDSGDIYSFSVPSDIAPWNYFVVLRDGNGNLLATDYEANCVSPATADNSNPREPRIIYPVDLAAGTYSGNNFADIGFSDAIVVDMPPVPADTFWQPGNSYIFFGKYTYTYDQLLAYSIMYEEGITDTLAYWLTMRAHFGDISLESAVDGTHEVVYIPLVPYDVFWQAGHTYCLVDTQFTNPSGAYDEYVYTYQQLFDFSVIYEEGISDTIAAWLSYRMTNGSVSLSDFINATHPPATINPGDIVINEFIPNPAVVSDTYGEWMELYNTTQGAIDLEGCIIKDDGSNTHTITTGGPLLVPAGGYVVLGRSSDPAINGGVTVDYQYANFTLGNTYDQIVLQNPAGTEIDRVNYDTSQGWTVEAGKSLELNDPSLDNSMPANWHSSNSQYGAGDYGTPGAVNSDDTPVLTVMNLPASNITPVSARLNGEIIKAGPSGGPYNAVVYWGTTDGGTDPAAWENSKMVEQIYAEPFYVDLDSGDEIVLQPDTQYYYRCYAVFAGDMYYPEYDDWADQTATFTTLPDGLTVVNGGASNVTSVSARLNGEITQAGDSGGPYNAVVYWGTTDGGTDSAAWENSKMVEQIYAEPFYVDLDSGDEIVLQPDTQYYYRCYAVFAGDMYYPEYSAWATETDDFRTLPASDISPGDLVINEFIPDSQAVSDTYGEWIELYNPTGSDIDINGCVIKDNGSNTHTISRDGGVIIRAGSYLVLGRSDDQDQNGDVRVDYKYGNFSMSNSVDQIILLAPDGMEVDRVEYDTSLGWVLEAGKSAELNNTSSDNNVPSNWHVATTCYGGGDYGTPGRVNSPTSYAAAYPVYAGEFLAEGYYMGVASSGGRTDWVTNMGGYMDMAYPAGNDWGAVFITVGEPCQPPRPSRDLSFCHAVALELKGASGGEDVYIGVKDNTDPDDGTNTKMHLINLDSSWKRYVLPLSAFDTLDPGSVYVACELVFISTNAATVSFRNIEYVSIQEPTTVTFSGDVQDGLGLQVELWMDHPDPELREVLARKLLEEDTVFSFTAQADIAPWNYFILLQDGNGGSLTENYQAVCQDPAVADNSNMREPRIIYPVGLAGGTYAGNDFVPYSAGASDINPGDIIVTEFIPDSAGVSDTYGEWVELYNTTLNSINIQGCIIRDDGSNTHTISAVAPLIIPARSYLVLGRSADPALNGGVEVDYKYADFTLGNTSDQIVLERPDAVEIDRIDYDSSLGWPIEAGKSVELIDNDRDNGDPSNWHTATTQYGSGDFGTPGMSNSPLAFNSAYAVYVGEGFAEGYSMGIATSESVYDWVTNMSGHMQMDYPSGQTWGALFITVGQPVEPPRPSVDLSYCQAISLDLKGGSGGEDVYIGVKDNTDPDDGLNAKIHLTNLGTDWKTYVLPLAAFDNADTSSIYVAAEIVFLSTTSQTVSFRNVKYLSTQQPPEITFTGHVYNASGLKLELVTTVPSDPELTEVVATHVFPEGASGDYSLKGLSGGFSPWIYEIRLMNADGSYLGSGYYASCVVPGAAYNVDPRYPRIRYVAETSAGVYAGNNFARVPEYTLTHPVFMNNQLAEGYQMGVDTSEKLHDWVSSIDGSIRMSYPEGQTWGAVFITYGEAIEPPRPGEDLSYCQALSFELKGDLGGEEVWVGIKDNTDPDDGSDTKVKISGLTTDWKTYTIPLADFVTADVTRVYVAVELVFMPDTPAETVYFRNVQYLSTGGSMVSAPTSPEVSTQALPNIEAGSVKVFSGPKGYATVYHPQASIKINSVMTGTVYVKIYNMRYELVWEKTLEVAEGVSDVVSWTCTNASNEMVSSGIYLVHITGAGLDIKKKVAIVK